MATKLRSHRFASSVPAPGRMFSLLFLILGGAVLGGCSGGAGGGGVDNAIPPGSEQDKPGGGGTFFVDPHEGGGASRLRIADMFWGRLVDVHDVDAAGKASVAPIFRDFVVNENIQSDSTNYELITNPITQKTRLVILRPKGAPDAGGGTFGDLLEAATVSMSPVDPKNDDGSDVPPYSFVARNMVLVIRFDDVLDDSMQEEISLPETVKVFTGYPPILPFTPRLVFDPNHGGIVGGAFHSTRILVDMTISDAEGGSMFVSAPTNPLGLPPSIPGATDPNVSLRIPTALDYGSGQFEILQGIHGATVAFDANGPRDPSAPTRDIVRAVRSGNPRDLNNGFLLDLERPEVLGGWPFDVLQVVDDAGGEQGFDYLVLAAAFPTVCQGNPEEGDILHVNDRFLEVTQRGVLANGEVRDTHVRLLADEPLVGTNALLGEGLYLSTFDPLVPVETGCWVTFTPLPRTTPASNVWPESNVLLRFSEPMDPQSVLPFDTMMVIRGDVNTVPTATSYVVGEVATSSDLKEFTFAPDLPFAHSGQGDVYHLDIIGGVDGISDLAGNPLAHDPPKIEFDIDELAPLEANGGLVMRFSDVDELEPRGTIESPIYDVRGQFLYDLESGLIKPRPVQYSAAPADRTIPVPSIMIPFTKRLQTPLSALGSKLQTVWRYCDLGWSVSDETKFNVDVVNLSWSPPGGLVIGDYLELFEMRLSHSVRLPDEALDTNKLPWYPASGLLGAPSLYTDNILDDPLDPQKVVHNRALGYVINPVNLTMSATGTPLMAYPLNTGGGELSLYTWRNTAVLAKGGPAGAGIPLRIETDLPLQLYGPNVTFGSVAAVNQVPSYGLPLLMEIRCFPSDSGIGMNALDISLAINSSARPNFRAFSTGGVDQSGTVVIKNPDLELTPSGGYNPNSIPPGAPTVHNADNSFYVGQLDFVTRVSRVHTIWIDTLLGQPDFRSPVVEPRPSEQPAGTELVIEYRGAENIYGYTEDQPFDASDLDPYGEPWDLVNGGSVTFVHDDPTWKSDVDDVDGGRFLQMRFSFLSNVYSGLSPTLSAVGVAFENE